MKNYSKCQSSKVVPVPFCFLGHRVNSEKILTLITVKDCDCHVPCYIVLDIAMVGFVGGPAYNHLGNTQDRSLTNPKPNRNPNPNHNSRM